MNIAELENLLHLLDRKLIEIENSKKGDNNTILTHSILKFVKFLANQELSIEQDLLNSQYMRHISAADLTSMTSGCLVSQPQSYYATQPSIACVEAPSTICANCWQKSDGRHTHCTHALANTIADSDDNEHGK